MQIHELTYPRKNVHEDVASALKKIQDGPLGAVGQLVKGTAKELGNRAMASAQSGGSQQFAGQRISKGMRPDAAWQQSRQNFQRMVKPAVDAWQQNLQQLMARAQPPTTTTATLDPGLVKRMLDGMIDEILNVGDFRVLLDQLENQTDSEAPPEMQSGQKTIADVAGRAGDAIDLNSGILMDLVASPTSNQQAQFTTAWSNMILGGIMPLQHLATFYNNNLTPGTTNAMGSAAAQISPEGAQLLKSMGITTAGLAAIKNAAKGQTLQKTGNPAIDAVLKYSGVNLQ